jgi:hypothetical protein
VYAAHLVWYIATEAGDSHINNTMSACVAVDAVAHAAHELRG